MEKLILIAERIKGDNWKLFTKDWWKNCTSLTDTIEEYFQKTQYKGDFRLSPSTSKLYIIEVETEVKNEEKIIIPEKKFDIYGEK